MSRHHDQHLTAAKDFADTLTRLKVLEEAIKSYTARPDGEMVLACQIAHNNLTVERRRLRQYLVGRETMR